MPARGFTLIEVIVALGILCAAVLATGHLLAVGAESMTTSRAQTVSATLAGARLDQLRALPFVFDADGNRITDLSTDVSRQDPAAGGSGLAPAGVDSLRTSVSGYVDYLDAHGQWVSNAPSPPPEAVFVRRWSIEPFSGSPDALVLQVLVRPVAQGLGAGIRRGRAETRLVTIHVRTHE